MDIDLTVLVVFLFVYGGMVLGGIPGLALDRTGVAVLGAIALTATGHTNLEQAWKAMDVSTLALLLGLMIVSVQFRLGGFYTKVVAYVANLPLSPYVLLGATVWVVGVLSSVLVNDIVCLATTPVVIEACAKRRLDPVPFCLAIALSSNVGSALTLVGNPQNMLIGQTLHLSFSKYLWDASVPVVLGLFCVWGVIAFLWRKKIFRQTLIPSLEAIPFNAWQTTKGLTVLAGLLFVFLFTSIPRGISALTAAGILFLSRKMASRRFLGEVDWQLLVLFGGLFVINDCVGRSGIPQMLVSELRALGIDMDSGFWLFITTTVLSNLVSNVPAVMLLLPMSNHSQLGAILALSSTLAGNLLLVGSIANLIVADQASLHGVRITWKQHALVGIPITIITLCIAGAWLAFLQ
jgi:Na+/H+ antiporter NhaD/arsenite permease-like protein